MKKLFTALLFTPLLAASAMMASETPAVKDHWDTSGECVAASDAPFYYPSTKSNRTLGSSYAERGHPTGGCFHMELPDRFVKGGWGWVRIGKDRPMAYNWRTGTYDYLWWCVNKIDGFVPFPPEAGPPGKPGADGLNCWDLNGNGKPEPNEDLNGDDVWDARDCRGADGEPCEVYTTHSFVRKFKWQKCPGQERQRLRAGLRPWVKGTLIGAGIATGIGVAPLACITAASGAGLGALGGAATAAAADSIADDDDPSPVRNNDRANERKEDWR